MKVTQLHTVVNTATKEILGETGVVLEDLSNIVSIGKEIINSDNVDNYVKKLVNHIGKVIFVERVYSGSVPSVLMDAWEYGSIVEKISAELPEAKENDSWKLEDGKSYDQDIFYQPSVSAKFFNSKTTFEIPLSFTERQVKESFSSAEQLNGFISMLVTAVENSMTVKLDALIMRTINNMTGEVVLNELGDMTDLTKSSVKAMNLLTLFNEGRGDTEKLTAEQALLSHEFIRFATYTIGVASDRMAKISTLFNVGGKARFTPKDLQHVVLLSDFAKASDTYLRADVDHNELVALPKHEVVPYWQGSGENYAFADISKINVKTSSKKDIELTGILGVIFDRDALGVTNLDKRVTTNYNAKAEFYSNFYKLDAGFYNDLNENFIVFFVA